MCRLFACRSERGRADLGEAGQVLPLVALFMVVLFGMAALAIDVSRAYADLRFYRATADAAALAGAQDLQIATSRNVSSTEQTEARAHSLQSLEQALGGTAAGCDPTADIVDCPLTTTPYVVTIQTPSPSCSTCDEDRSVQVTVERPDYGLTFARVLGSNEWDLGTTSVAGLVFGKSFTIITLRPPKPVGSTFDVKDITLEGGSVVDVQQGDVGSNSNMNYSGAGAQLILDPGYNMYYFDPMSGPLWGTNPEGERLPTLIQDPNYTYPSMAGAPTFDDARTSQFATLPAVEQADVDPACATEAAKLDPLRYTFMATQAPDTIYCYSPGIYESGTGGGKNATITAGTGEVAILKPGAYYLKNGADISGRLVGGYEPGLPGVALMFNEAGPGNCSTCIYSGNNALTTAINAGTKFPASFGGGTAATAAIDWSGNPVQTSGPSGPTPPILTSMLVIKDPGCFVPTSPPFVEPASCNANKNKTMNIAGGGQLVIEGVQYMPTDNVEISGGSGAAGKVGQIISWTLKYSGGVQINQQGPSTEGPGTLRIDAACSAPGEPCNP